MKVLNDLVVDTSVYGSEKFWDGDCSLESNSVIFGQTVGPFVFFSSSGASLPLGSLHHRCVIPGHVAGVVCIREVLVLHHDDFPFCKRAD